MAESSPTARLAVLGSPIAHSKSPALHRAAYARLGLDWEYTAVEMTGDRLPAFLEGLDASWRGLSLTMPLKQDVLPLLDEVDELAQLTGAANTVLFEGGRRLGFNTDVGGIVRSLAEAGLEVARTAIIIGGGATAASSMVAIAELGVAHVRVLLRRPEAGAKLVDLGRSVGLIVDVDHLGALAHAGPADLVVSTLPGGTDTGSEVPAELVSSALLLDVAYAPWPTPLAKWWIEGRGRVIDGSGMLLQQAFLQVRIFAGGDPAAVLSDESGILTVMRSALRS
ncbi:shikimate dehydrogenase [Agromyces sp. NPDC058136]|uniref:shikimate dehydrogenase n=1 Tax=Agromyces sp. NPDC058136 TaxID=3346354 RepID=UPI0036DF3021